MLTKLQGQKDAGLNVDEVMQDTLSEISKVHMSTANLFRMMGDKAEARTQYLSAIDYFELLGDSKMNQSFENIVRGEFND